MESEDHIESTFVMIKPDGVKRGLIGEIISRLEEKGLELRALKFKNLDIETAKKHYVEHMGKPFYDHLVYYAVSYTHLRAHETDSYLVCRLLLEKKNNHPRPDS